MQTVNVLGFMFTPPKSEIAERLKFIAKVFSDFDMRRYEPDQLGDIAAKMLMARQALDHAFGKNFETDPKSLPQRIEDIPGAKSYSDFYGVDFDDICTKCGKLVDGCYGGCLACDLNEEGGAK